MGKSGKRASRRVPVDIPAGYVQPSFARGVTRIVELSAGGCLLRKTLLDPGGPEVMLHFRFGPHKDEMELRGRVVRAQEGVGTALEFVAISPEGRERIRQLVATSPLEPTRRVLPR